MPSLGPERSRRTWRELRAAGVPTFSRWAHEDARTAPPPPVLPADLPEERLGEALVALAAHAGAARRVEARLLADLLRLRAGRP
ncbi:MAG TPA: hypothetical protein VNO79_10965 [Actinomycetota bacterium]|nr:hypothetical protein [Actinomycetota bacterium]